MVFGKKGIIASARSSFAFITRPDRGPSCVSEHGAQLFEPTRMEGEIAEVAALPTGAGMPERTAVPMLDGLRKWNGMIEKA
jgi:hypothetical protein